jgi:hypothetical protein
MQLPRSLARAGFGELTKAFWQSSSMPGMEDMAKHVKKSSSFAAQSAVADRHAASSLGQFWAAHISQAETTAAS